MRRLRILLGGRFGPLPRPKKWVFIVGCYNSGTSLLHDLLATHPGVGSMPTEGQFLTDQLTVPRSVGLPRLWALEPERFCLAARDGNNIDVDRMKRQWGSFYDDPARPVLLEKSPTNAARTLWLQAHFEASYFVGIIRDGYAVAEGIRRKAGHPLAVAATQWAQSNRIMLRDFAGLNHAMLVRYEALAERPDEILTEILEFLGLPVVHSGLRDRPWRIHEQVSTIRNMNDKSFSALTQVERKAIESVASDVLDQLGYLRRQEIS